MLLFHADVPCWLGQHSRILVLLLDMFCLERVIPRYLHYETTATFSHYLRDGLGFVLEEMFVKIYFQTLGISNNFLAYARLQFSQGCRYRKSKFNSLLVLCE